MSRRPIEEKQRRRASKVFSRRALPVYFDLVRWLVEHDHAPTRRKARELLLAGKVRSGSHVVGMRKVPTLQADGKTIKEEAQVVQCVPSTFRDSLLVGS